MKDRMNHHGTTPRDWHEGAAMPLSEREQQLLDELEAQLTASDPRFATTMGADPRERDRRRRRMVGTLTAMVGLALIGLSAYLKQPWLGAFALGLTVMGLVYAVTPSTKESATLRSVETPFGGPGGTTRHTGGSLRVPSVGRGSRPARAAASSSPLMTRLEERWERRRRESQGW